jgi:very-short-patch-repair endonuclease
MIATREEKSTQTADLYRQRFNVAMSRGRDRVYLYHSVKLEDLNPQDLKAGLLRHFQAPLPDHRHAPEETDDILAQCDDSEFERTVCRRLLEHGYAVTPQVQSGQFRIDLVVEGEKDRRLAIELDGDRYHPPEQWRQDFERQRILERVGWRFWRCFASTYTRDPEGCFADLLETLEREGITPTAQHHQVRRLSEQRVWTVAPLASDLFSVAGVFMEAPKADTTRVSVCAVAVTKERNTANLRSSWRIASAWLWLFR